MFTRTESFQEFIRYYPVVSVIVSIHILLYLLTSLPIFPNSTIMQQLSGVNFYIWQGEIWRLVTPIFLHSGFSHVLFNSFSLVLFGPALERILGSLRFTWIYLITGISANVATLLIEPVTYIHLGASGAIFGLFGMYISLNVFRKHLLSKDNRQLITTIAVISIIMTFFQPNINVISHLFGFLSGFLIGALSLRKRT
ncbi:rhomboid family intramembrane serine protease [Niallia endozanthoxylica]|uniref:Rhomboid family intramembrane serine protease n=1 Tax=Niallia endozanthoxylica TaxID=2036016 RepID=A0A5J5HB15_9BACI|nr:rhomboid family intramembrane serine protease [Niallia endozanthoxylica]KAA9017098.1 rhomboid family intramembrane serine protease [Niallia endozanthoxylica]